MPRKFSSSALIFSSAAVLTWFTSSIRAGSLALNRRVCLPEEMVRLPLLPDFLEAMLAATQKKGSLRGDAGERERRPQNHFVLTKSRRLWLHQPQHEQVSLGDVLEQPGHLVVATPDQAATVDLLYVVSNLEYV